MNRCLHLLSLFFVLFTPSIVNADEAGGAVDRYFEAYEAMDLEQMIRAYSPDAEFIDVLQRHQVRGTESLRQLFSGLLAVHSEMRIEEQRRIVSGNLVAVDYVYQGILSGESLKAATGKETCVDTSYRIPVTTWFAIKDERIQQQTDFIDLATLNEVKAEALGAGVQ